jgi:sodium/pantothenate symporter
MPEFATFLTAAADVPWLAGLVVAAPFAAVMSSVDSFLLMFSSGIVRDIYQEHIDPNAPDKKIRRLTYTSTAVVGIAATIAALNPPEFLQTLIVFSTSGLAVGFLVPMALAIYWPRMNAAGVICGMSGGCLVLLGLYITNSVVNGKFGSYALFGFDSFLWGVIASAICAVGGALATAPPDQRLVDRYFHEK